MARVLEDRGEVSPSLKRGVLEGVTASLRRFATAELPDVPVTIGWAESRWSTRTDDGGFVVQDVSIPPGVDPGWHRVELSLSEPPSGTSTEVMVVGPEAELLVVSDIDDTVIDTQVTRRLRRAEAMFLSDIRERRPFPDTASLYRALQQGAKDGTQNPVAYVSSSPWNLYEHLELFLDTHGFPKGPILLRDWGLHRHGFAPDGSHQHKLEKIATVLSLLPDLPVLLLGDSSQEDPVHYQEISRRYPERVVGVLIRRVHSKPTRLERLESVKSEMRRAGTNVCVFDSQRSGSRLLPRARLDSMTESPNEASPLLNAEGLVKTYGGRRAVDELSLQCGARSVLGLLGPNGAGKTTTLRLLYGFIRPEAGSIRYAGEDFAKHRDRLKRIIGVCTQDDTLDYDFSVAQNLRVYAGYFRPRVEDLSSRVDELLQRFNLMDRRDASPRTLSGGFKRRLLIARSIIHRPRILFLDEPTTGLDPKARVAVWELIDQLRGEGMGIILTTHYMDEAERLSDQLLVLSDGHALARGTTGSVLGDLLGEHVVVLRDEQTDPVRWLETSVQSKPLRVLGEVQFSLGSRDLARFSEAFPDIRFVVRQPNLDDLFLALEDVGQAPGGAA